MNLNCIKINKWKIYTNIYEKPGHIHTYPHRNSSLPHTTKTGFIRGELIRYIVLSSTKQTYLSQKRKFINRLNQWGYTNKFIRTAVNQPKYEHRNNLIQSMIDKKNNSNDNILNDNNKKRKPNQLYLVKRYDSRYDNHKLLRELINSNITKNTALERFEITISNQVNRKLRAIIKPNIINEDNNENNNTENIMNELFSPI